MFTVEAKLEGDIPALEKRFDSSEFRKPGKSGTIDFVSDSEKKPGKVEKGRSRVSSEGEAMQQKTEEIPIKRGR